eukprot:CAMPEP_0182614404 /NCGR_PEP_ID=MMETSP1330-20130603/30347_1 /TAXON_ID=464278 /ORGANISM="Picochlorum sp., Strain RCC944" /LENGTH=73 /DNA_ID=CAMNT_0024834213 /DNA_START=221 /DNA_END=439 /DNA_ORIENTATION=+
MVVVTQVGKLGNLLQARQDEFSQTYSVDVLLGRRDDPLLEVCARQLIERLALAGDRRNLLLWIALKGETSTST